MLMFLLAVVVTKLYIAHLEDTEGTDTKLYKKLKRIEKFLKVACIVIVIAYVVIMLFTFTNLIYLF